MKQRQAVTAVTGQRYRQGSKKVKQQLLDEFCEITGYCRGYARYVLRNHGRQVWLGGKRARVGDACKRQQRLKPKVYDEPVLAELHKLWELLNYVCGKRLVAIMPELIAKLEQFGELRLPASTKEKLLRISAATVDRLLQPERRKQQLRRRSQTKPGTLLSDYCQTLDLTDVCSGWTETEAVPNKAQVWVFEAIQTIRARLPFPLLGLDSDNGSEFVNEELLRYCQRERLTFTRARPYRKNDNCYVEQKNYSVVRQTVGYQRFDTTAELMVLKQLYTTLRLYTNFFQPTMKLKSKERFGSRVKKSYHAPQTPYQRVLACAEVTAADKKKLQRQYQQLNPAALKRELDKQRKELFRLAAHKRPVRSKRYAKQKDLKIKPPLMI